MIVGPDEQGEAQVLLDMIKEAKLKRVKIQGPVFGDKKIELMGSASIFALPTRSENFAMTVAESLSKSARCIIYGAPWSELENRMWSLCLWC